MPWSKLLTGFPNCTWPTDITGQPPGRIVRAGIALVPENRLVFPEMDIEENLRAGAYTRSSDIDDDLCEPVMKRDVTLLTATTALGGSRRDSGPDAVGDRHQVGELGPLLVFGERVAFDRAREPALGTQAQLLLGHEGGSFGHSGGELVVGLELGTLGCHEAEQAEDEPLVE